MARRRRRQAASRQVVTRQKVRREVREARPRRQFGRLTKTSLEPILASQTVRPHGYDVVRRGPTRASMRNTSNVAVHYPSSARPIQFGALESAMRTERPKPRKSVCASRRERREVIFAKSLRAKGAASSRRVFTETSREFC